LTGYHIGQVASDGAPGDYSCEVRITSLTGDAAADICGAKRILILPDAVFTGRLDYVGDP